MSLRLISSLAITLGLLVFTGCGPADRDRDGIPNNVDMCIGDAEDKDTFQDNDGCPDPDNDKDGVCDAWVAQNGHSAKFANVCRGSDKCQMEPEDRDGFEDENGCPDADNDGDGVIDRLDKCPNEVEDVDGFQDADGCPDPDNDADGVCDTWVAERGLSAKFVAQCKGSDNCGNQAEDKDGFQEDDGCPDADNDGDGIPDVVDQCANEAGRADNKGCPKADAEPLPETLELSLRFTTGMAELTFEDRIKLNTGVVPGLKAHPSHKVYLYVFMPMVEIPVPTFLELINGRTQSIVAHLESQGVKREQIRTRTITEELFIANQGTEEDFNSARPVIFKRK